MFLESLRRTATFQKQCFPESQRKHKPGHAAHANCQHPTVHPMLLRLQPHQHPLQKLLRQPRSLRGAEKQLITLDLRAWCAL